MVWLLTEYTSRIYKVGINGVCNINRTTHVARLERAWNVHGETVQHAQCWYGLYKETILNHKKLDQRVI